MVRIATSSWYICHIEINYSLLSCRVHIAGLAATDIVVIDVGHKTNIGGRMHIAGSGQPSL
jgi:hypothetical protein